MADDERDDDEHEDWNPDDEKRDRKNREEIVKVGKEQNELVRRVLEQEAERMKRIPRQVATVGQYLRQQAEPPEDLMSIRRIQNGWLIEYLDRTPPPPDPNYSGPQGFMALQVEVFCADAAAVAAAIPGILKAVHPEITS